jgi:hypothetical protein
MGAENFYAYDSGMFFPEGFAKVQPEWKKILRRSQRQ